MQDNKLHIGRKIIWSSTVIAVEPYTERDAGRGSNAITPEDTKAWVVTTSGSFPTPMPPKDFVQFGFAHLPEDNVALNPFHFPRRPDNSYMFSVDEAPQAATTREGASAQTKLTYTSAGKPRFIYLVADSETVFDLVNPRSQSVPAASNPSVAAEPAASPERPARARGRRDTSGPASGAPSDPGSGPGG